MSVRIDLLRLACTFLTLIVPDEYIVMKPIGVVIWRLMLAHELKVNQVAF